MKLNLSTEKKHSVSPYLFMQFGEPLGTADSSVDAAWNFLEDRWHEKFLARLKELNPTMIRFGGCFASFYHWKEAVGPQSERVPMYNLCWDGMYSNMVGTKEIIELCRYTGAEPLMVVNMESDGRMYWAYPGKGMNRLGTAEEAAEWVAYCNDPDNALRISHGDKDPYNVRFWQIGNETSYEKGFTKEENADRALKFARAMRSADPSVKLIGWGDAGANKYRIMDSGRDEWLERLMDVAGEEIDLVAFHYHFRSAYKDSPLDDLKFRRDPAVTWHHLMSPASEMEKYFDFMRDQIKPYGKRLAMTEGHYSLPGRDRCDVLSTWGAGVSYARCMLTQERASDIIDISTLADFFGNRWQVNAIMLPSPIGSGPAYLQPVGTIMKLFRHHIGEYAIDVEKHIDGVDLAASISDDGKKIFLHAVNTSMDSSRNIELTVNGMLPKKAVAYTVASDPMTEVTPLNPDVFSVSEISIEGGVYTLPAAGVTAIELEF